MAPTQMATTIEGLYDQLGGMGRFQVMTSFFISLCQVPMGWSMLQMSFAGVIPDFHCLLDELWPKDGSSSHTFTPIPLRLHSNISQDVCYINGTKCDSYLYDTSAMTVIREWDLVCDMKWVKKVIISIQMAGVLVGTVGAGQFSDVFGRKKVMYTFVSLHVVLNIIAGFSINWVMFSCLRFLIGICIGAVIVVVGTFQMEFLPIKWRPLLGVIPSFTLGVGIFAGMGALLEDWSQLHFACATLSFVALAGIFFIPDSPRWLVVQCRLKEAEQVLKRIADMHKQELPENAILVLQSVQSKNRVDPSSYKYTYMDLFKQKRIVKISLVFFYYWFILAIVYYGISFGIGSLSGNLYLNIFLLGIMEIPVQSTTFCLNNKIGRRKTTLCFFALCFLSLLGCLVISSVSSGNTKDVAINVLSLIAKVMVGSAWSSVQVWGTESFPTVTRNLGCGFSALGARVGGILAPFVIDLDEMMSLSYGICCVLLVIGSVLLFIIPETMGKSLRDTMNVPSECVSEDNPTMEDVDMLMAPDKALQNISSISNDKNDKSIERMYC